MAIHTGEQTAETAAIKPPAGNDGTVTAPGAEAPNVNPLTPGTGAQALDDMRQLLSRLQAPSIGETMMQLGTLPRVSFDAPSTGTGSGTGTEQPRLAAAEHQRPVEAPRPPERESPPPLTAEQRYFAQFYQQRFLDNLSTITTRADGQSPEQFQQQVAARAEAIKKEMERGEFGPESQAAFKDYLQWLQKKAIPGMVSELSSSGVGLPAGSPVEIPLENGRRISVEDYISRIINGRLPVDLQLDPTRPPTLEEAQRLENAVDWMGRGAAAIKDARLQALDNEIERLIKERGLPAGWLYNGADGADKMAWRASVTAMLEVTLGVGRSIDIIQKLGLPIPLPEGVRTVRQPDGSTKVVVDLPNDTRLNDPSNLLRMQRLQEWLEKVQPLIKNAVDQLQVKPHEILAWGDLAIPNVRNRIGLEVSAQATFDANGRLTGIIDPTKDKPADGESARDVNLLEQRFTATVLPNGDIEVRQTVQAQHVPFYGYLNSGAENVGQPADIPPRTLKPDDMVAVRTGSGVQYMLARDLPNFIATQRAWHYGEKVVTAAVDLTMLAAGAFKSGGAALALRELTIAELAGTGGRRLAWTMMRGMFEMGLGLTGVLGNGYWSETEAGRLANAIRGGLFVLTAGAGIVNAGLAMRAARFSRGADGIETTVMNTGEIWSHRAMGALQVPMIPMVGSMLYEQIKELYKDPHALVTALQEYLSAPEGRSFPPPDTAPSSGRPDRPGTVPNTIDGFKKQLTANLPDTLEGRHTRDVINDIFDRLGRAIENGGDRQALIKELTANLSFNISDIRQLQRLNRGELTPQQLRDLADPAKRGQFPAPLAKLAAELMAQKDQSVITASQIALLYLTSQTGRQSDGTLPPTIGDTSIHLPPQRVGMGTGQPQLLPERDVHLDIDTQSLITQLRQKLSGMQPDGQAIAVGGALLKVGALTPPQFAALLQSVLNNPRASAADKINAISDGGSARLGALISGQRLMEYLNANSPNLTPEQRAQYIIRNFGTTSTDLQATLARTASGDADPNVRAAAALALYGLTRLYASGEDGTRVLTALDTLVQTKLKAGGNPADFAKEVTTLLLTDLQNAAPNDVQKRIDAAQALLSLAAKADAGERERIQTEVSKQLVQSLLQADGPNAARVMSMLTPELIDRLRQSGDAALLAGARDHVLSLLKPGETYTSQEETALMALLKTAGNLFGNDDPERTSRFVDAAAQVLNNSLPSYTAVRAAAVTALSSVNTAQASQILERTAQFDRDASVRLAALKALEKRNQANLPDLVKQLLSSEADPAVATYLRQLSERQDRSAAAANFEDYQRAVWERYPRLREFDLAAQRDFIKQNFPLLDRATFEKAIQTATAGQDEDELRGQQLGDQVARERDAQFQKLVELAQGNAEDEKTQQARLVLLSLITGGLSPAGSDRILIGLATRYMQNGLIPYMEEVYYGEIRHDWSLQAAQALAGLLQSGRNGRDLTKLFIALALRSSITGKSREVLERAA